MPASQGLGLDALPSWERRARFSVGVGCPSFGGQRTVRGHFGLPPAKLVKKLKPRRYVTAQQCLRSRPELGVGTTTGSVLPPWLAGQTETAAAPVLHSQAGQPVASPISSGPSALHGKSITVGTSPVPNPSVKGTSAGGPPLTSNVRPCTMPLFTVFFEYRGGTYIEQVKASDVSSALRSWAEHLEPKSVKFLGRSRKRQLVTEIEAKLTHAQPPTQLAGLQNAWCAGAFLGAGLVNLVQTEPSSNAAQI